MKTTVGCDSLKDLAVQRNGLACQVGRRVLFIFGFLSILVYLTLSPAWADYAYRKAITIDHTMVSGGQSLVNFPVLISISADADLRTTVNGGHVEQSNGYDMEFRAADGSIQLAHEVESYVSASGQLVAWVNIPVLSNTVDTVIYLYYGDDQITSSRENRAGVAWLSVLRASPRFWS